jgi:hypothetical protein
MVTSEVFILDTGPISVRIFDITPAMTIFPVIFNISSEITDEFPSNILSRSMCMTTDEM